MESQTVGGYVSSDCGRGHRPYALRSNALWWSVTNRCRRCCVPAAAARCVSVVGPCEPGESDDSVRDVGVDAKAGWNQFFALYGNQFFARYLHAELRVKRCGVLRGGGGQVGLDRTLCDKVD